MLPALKRHPVANYDKQEIAPAFIVLHHTGVSRQETLDIFNRAGAGSAHLVIDQDGTTYECVPCWDGKCLRAWHAGVSKLQFAEKLLENFNGFSIGIELVSLNGNFFSFTQAQYDALIAALEHLKNKYPGLSKPSALIGHQHIAGFRGKCDPGDLFDWTRVTQAVYASEFQYNLTKHCSNSTFALLGDIYWSLSEQQLWERPSLAAGLSTLSELAQRAVAGQDFSATALQELTQHCEQMASKFDESGFQKTAELVKNYPKFIAKG